ncbi:DUF4747 family protein [Aeromonas veronii]
MPSFKYYNVQALPLNQKTSMIGHNGYKKIFESLKELVDESIQKNNLRSISYELRNDFYIAPTNINITDEIAYGLLMKYDEVHKVFGTLDNHEKFTSNGGDSSKKYTFRFVFDFEKHIMAIEITRGLPSSNVIIESLESLLYYHMNKNYPEHTLKIIEMTNSEDLASVIYEATSYKKVEVDVTFSNSEDWSDAIEDEILKEIENEMKEKQVDSLIHIEKAAKDSVMTLPTKIAMTYLGLACKFGNAIIRYKNNLGKTEIFKMTDHPIKITVDEKTGKIQQTELDYALDVKTSINEANNIAMNARNIIGSLRSGGHNARKN